MRMSPAIFDYSGVPIDGAALCDGVASADLARQGWPPTLTPTCCDRLLLDFRFLPIHRSGKAYTRSPLRFGRAGQFVYRIMNVAAAEAEPVLALLCRLPPLAK
jgi:hypothetical protein